MFSVVNSGGIRGLQVYPVRVEVDIARGLPGFELVGSAAGEVKEAKERVVISMKNAGVRMPVAKITVNLSPADIRKEGTLYDLPIAAGLLAAMGEVEAESFRDTAFLGELALGGEIRKANGVLPIALGLRDAGIRCMVVPRENLSECMELPGMEFFGAENIREFMGYLRADEETRRKMHGQRSEEREALEKKNVPDFSDVCGQECARRAAELAAGGFHNLMLAGPPGAGKTMIAERIPGILPPLSEAECLEVSSIYSVAGKLRAGAGLLRERPFVAPHHTISAQAFAGGGRIPRPGLISLAHRGILFLDEMPQFASNVLEVLRQPMESKRVQIARSNGTYDYPADFMLVCAANPCPCGYFPDRNKCACTEPEVRRYFGKISGPILDRIDLIVQVPAADIREFGKKKGGEPTAAIRARVMEARLRQKKRFQDSGYQFNGELPGRDVSKFIPLSLDGQRFLESAAEAGEMSARGYHKIIKLARTIADIEGAEEVAKTHLAEALFFNSGEKRFGI